MNILQILPNMDVGGVETGVLDLSKELVKLGHKVIVISNGGKMVRSLLDANVKHIKLPVHKKSLFTILKMIKQLELIIKEEKIDIVHARSRVPAIISFFATRRTHTNFITTAHGYYSTHFLSRPMGYGKFVIVASTIVGRHMIEDFGVPSERIRFIPRGVDLQRFNFSPRQSHTKLEYKIGVVGRITPIKGHDFFLQAIARVVRLFPKIRILIVGEPPEDKPEYKENLERLVNRLNIAKVIEFLGPTNNIPEVMSGLDILVVPSIGQEAFGRVIIEAGASGVPVIATRVGGVVDIIENGRTGIIVEPGDIMGLVDAIMHLLQDRDFAGNIAIEARKKVEKEYNLDNMVENTIRVYEEAYRKKILVIKLGAIGDAILSIPSIRGIREVFPNAFISVLVGPPAKAVFKKCPYIDDIILYDRDERDRGIIGLVKISSLIRRKAYDISIDFQNNRRSHISSWLGGIPQRFGYNNKLGILLNNKVAYSEHNKLSPIEGQFKVLQGLGIHTGSLSRRLELWPGKEDYTYIENFLRDEWIGERQEIVGVNIGGSWQTKRWPLEYFAGLVDQLALKGIRVVVTGANGELELAKRLSSMVNIKIINAVGRTTLLQLSALIKRCRVYITGDSAPMHIAGSVGTDFIALFGPTDPNRHYEPVGTGVIIKKDTHCSPCYKSECKRLRCMKAIGVDEVCKLVMEKMMKPKPEI